MNNLFALIVFNIFLPMINSENSTSLNMIFIAYHLFGAFILSLFMFFLTQILALLIGKNRVNQFVLFIGVVVLTTSLSYLFHVSAMLTLFSLGVLARNLDHHHLLMEVDFGWLARLFFILLFVVTGAHLQLHGLTTLFGGILLIILARTLTKTFGIYLFSKKSKLSPKQAFALSLALSPMAGVAIGLSNILIDFNPEFGYHLLLIITGVVTVLHILGPIATQLSFIISDEALSIRQHHFERTS